MHNNPITSSSSGFSDVLIEFKTLLSMMNKPPGGRLNPSRGRPYPPRSYPDPPWGHPDCLRGHHAFSKNWQGPERAWKDLENGPHLSFLAFSSITHIFPAVTQTLRGHTDQPGPLWGQLRPPWAQGAWRLKRIKKILPHPILFFLKR